MWQTQLQRWRQVDRGQEELDRLEDERVLLKTKLERHRVMEKLEETKAFVDANAERRWHGLAASRRINFRCIRLLHNFVNEVNELNEQEVQRSFVAVVTEKVREDKANGEEERRIAEAQATAARIVSEAEELEFRRVSVHEQQAQGLAQKMADDEAEAVKAAEYEALLNDLDREAMEAKALVERVPALVAQITEIENAGWKVDTRDGLLAKARARPKRDINQDVADEKEVSIKAYEPWVAFVAGELEVLQESQTREHEAHLRAVAEAAATAEAVREKEAARVEHEAQHEDKSVRRFLQKQADAAELAIDGERCSAVSRRARRRAGSRSGSRGSPEHRALPKGREGDDGDHHRRAEALAEQGTSERRDAAGYQPVRRDPEQAQAKGLAALRLAPEPAAPRQHRLLPPRAPARRRRGLAGGGPDAHLEIEVDTMALDELLDLVRNEKLTESPQVLNMLPENVHAWVTSAAFEQECNEKFMDLDADRAGILGPRTSSRWCAASRRARHSR